MRGALTGSGTTYALSVVAASGAGQIVFSIAADVVSPNNESITISFARLAYPTLGILSSIPAIYEGETFDIDFVFSAPVTGFHVSDITLTGATAGTLTGSGATYALSVIADSGAGSIVVTVGAAAVIPGNHGATQTFTRLAYPSLVITSSDADIQENETFTATFAWSAPVTSFTISDIGVTGATQGAFTSINAFTYRLVLTANAGMGDIVISLASNVVLPGNHAQSQTFAYSRIPTPPVWLTGLGVGCQCGCW